MPKTDKDSFTRIKASLGLRRNVVVLGATQFLLVLFSEMWIPFLPLFLEQEGAQVSYIGLIFSIILFVSTLAEVPGGIVADRVGRKPTIVVASFLLSIVLLFLGLSRLWAVIMVFLAIYYVLSSISKPAITAMLGETSSETDRGTTFGSFYFFVSLGSVVGPLIGALLMQRKLFQSIFLGSALAAAVSVLLQVSLLRETKKPVVEDQDLRERRKIEKPGHPFNRTVLIFITAIIGFSLAGGLVYPFTALFSEKVLKFSATEFGIMISAANLVALIANVPLGKICDKIGKRKSLVVSWLGISLLTSLWVFSPNFLLAIVNYMASSVFFSLNIIAYNAFAITITSEETRGSMIGLFEMVMGFAMSGGPIVGGFLWYVNPFFPFLTCGILGAVSACILVLTNSRGQKQ